MAAIAVVIYQAVNLCDLMVPARVVAPNLAAVPFADWPARFVLAVFSADTAIIVFFMLSGLLLSRSLQREHFLNATAGAGFIFRRILRIYPALALTVLAFGAASYFSLPALFSFPFSPHQMLLNSLLLDTGVNGETWALQVQMLLAPVVLIVAWLQRRLGAMVPFGFAALVLASVVAGTPIFIPPMPLLALALGMLTATDAVRRTLSRAPAWLWGPCFAAVILERFFMFGGPAVALLGPVLLSALAVGVVFYRASGDRILSGSVLTFFGRIGYCLYLWHAAVMYELFPYFQTFLGAERISRDYLLYGMLYSAVVFGVAVPLAWLTWRWVEQPAIAFSRQILSPADLYRLAVNQRWFKLLKCMFVGREAGGLAVLLLVFLALNCISIATIERSQGVQLTGPVAALAGMLLLACFTPLFLLPAFSFGYLVGVAFFGMIAGFVWITHFGDLNYDHELARLSAVVSLLAFLLPVLFQRAPLPKPVALSPHAMNRLLVLTLWLAAAVLVWNARYGFAIVGIREAEELRSTFARPAVLNYVTGSLIGGVLPFAFGYFALQRRYAMAALSLFLVVSFYPVLLTKTVLFAALWLPFLFVMFQTFEPKRATVLLLLIPLTAGLLFYAVAPRQGPVAELSSYLFGYVNIRMFAIPSIAMNYYSEFFDGNPLTGFCQINIVRAFTGCPYTKQLGPVLADRYGLGNLNASLFATEGIASVGPLWAPLSALVCGVIVSIGNNVSARLPPALIAASAGLALQALLNVALSTTVLSNGLLALLILWYLAPDAPAERSRCLTTGYPLAGADSDPDARPGGTMKFSGLLIVCSIILHSSASLADSRIFILANPQQTSGIDRCLAESQECGAATAKAYCRSRDFSEAKAYRKVDAAEITGSVPKPAAGDCPSGGCDEYLAIICQR